MLKPLDEQLLVSAETDFGELAQDMVVLSKRIRALFGIALADSGLHNGQDHLMMVLVPECFSAVSTLAEELDIRPSTVSKMLDRLTEKGLVVRIPDERDGRKTLVMLTADGSVAQKKICELWAEVSRSLTSRDHEEAALMTSQVRQLNENLLSRLRRLR
jgi:DNA-binding MarR family transcriptional regulator